MSRHVEVFNTCLSEQDFMVKTTEAMQSAGFAYKCFKNEWAWQRGREQFIKTDYTGSQIAVQAWLDSAVYEEASPMNELSQSEAGEYLIAALNLLKAALDLGVSVSGDLPESLKIKKIPLPVPAQISVQAIYPGQAQYVQPPMGYQASPPPWFVNPSQPARHNSVAAQPEINFQNENGFEAAENAAEENPSAYDLKTAVCAVCGTPVASGAFCGKCGNRV